MTDIKFKEPLLLALSRLEEGEEYLTITLGNIHPRQRMLRALLRGTRDDIAKIRHQLIEDLAGDIPDDYIVQ